MTYDGLVTLVVFAVVIAVLSLAVIVAVRRAQAWQAALADLKAREGLLSLIQDVQGLRADLHTLNGGRALRSRRTLLGLTPEALVLFEARLPLPEVLRLPLAQVRWYGRPEKYQDGRNEIWLHWERAEGWQILKLNLHRSPMTEFVRMLKTVTPPELVTAYRRRRPYIHLGPLPAQPATQDLYGAWTLQAPLSLYLMPRALVFLEGAQVLRVIALDHIEEIGTLARMDDPGADGLLRFRAEQESLAFAVRDAQGVAGRVAEAARLNLEAPLEPKRKGKNHPDEEWEWEE